MKSKAVKVGARERKIINNVARMEDELKKYISQLMSDKKRVTHTSIVRKAMEIKKDFIGGVNGVGQKLPKDWEQKYKHLKDHVARAQQPTKFHPNKYWIPGMYHGFLDEKQCHVTNGEGERNCFTTQLSITKSGKKLKPFVI
eukprot:5907554-Ditylum_brightwellii.AAC.1